MGYRVEISKQVRKRLKKLSSDTSRRILLELYDIGTLDDPHMRGKLLTGPYKGLWRYRVGDYRIICDIHDDALVVVAVDVGHRSEIYRRKLR